VEIGIELKERKLIEKDEICQKANTSRQIGLGTHKGKGDAINPEKSIAFQ